MNKAVTTRLWQLSLLLPILLQLLLPEEALAESLLVTSTTVHTQTERGVIEGAHVLVENGRISRISESPIEAQVDKSIDGEGLIMTPGLIAAYSQFGLDEIDLEPTTVDSLLLNTAPNIGPAFDIQYAYSPVSTVIDVNLVEGVTHGVVAPRPGPDVIAGVGAFAELHVQGITASGVAMFSDIGARIAEMAGGSRAASLGKLHYALEQIAGFRPRGYVSGLGEYSRRDMLALKAHLESGAPFVVRSHRASDIRQLVALAEVHDLNLVILGATEAWQVAALLAEHDIPVIIDPLENLPLSFEQLGARLDNASILARHGVQVAIVTSDTHNARLMRQHAGNAVAHGLPWSDGLYAITRAPVDIYGLDDNLGRLQTGSPANFVLWTGDPLEVTTWAHAVIVNGSIVDPSTRQTQLYERYQRLGRQPHEYGYQR